jgi:hypothetical protein
MAKFTAPAQRSTPYNVQAASMPGQYHLNAVNKAGAALGQGLQAVVGSYMQKKNREAEADIQAETLFNYMEKKKPDGTYGSYKGLFKDEKALARAINSNAMGSVIAMQANEVKAATANASQAAAATDQLVKIQGIQKNNDERFVERLGQIPQNATAYREFGEDWLQGKTPQDLQMTPKAVQWLKKSGVMHRPAAPTPQGNPDIWNPEQVKEYISEGQTVLDKQVGDYTKSFLNIKSVRVKTETHDGFQTTTQVNEKGDETFLSRTPITTGKPKITSEISPNGVVTISETTTVGGQPQTKVISSTQINPDDLTPAQRGDAPNPATTVSELAAYNGDQYATMKHRLVAEQVSMASKSKTQIQERMQEVAKESREDEVSAVKAIDDGFKNDPTLLGEDVDTVAKAILARELLAEAGKTGNPQLAQAATRYFIRMYEKGILTEADIQGFGSPGWFAQLKEQAASAAGTVDLALMESLAQAAEITYQRIAPKVAARVENLYQSKAKAHNIPLHRLMQISPHTDLSKMKTLTPWDQLAAGATPGETPLGDPDQNAAAFDAALIPADSEFIPANPFN